MNKGMGYCETCQTAMIVFIADGGCATCVTRTLTAPPTAVWFPGRVGRIREPVRKLRTWRFFSRFGTLPYETPWAPNPFFKDNFGTKAICKNIFERTSDISLEPVSWTSDSYLGLPGASDFLDQLFLPAAPTLPHTAFVWSSARNLTQQSFLRIFVIFLENS